MDFFSSPALPTNVAFNSVSFTYPSLPNSKREVLKKITFSLQPGTCTLLLGANGTGKTTCLKLAAGLLNPQQGKVECPACREKKVVRVGYLSQNFSQLNQDLPLTVEKVALLGTLLDKKPFSLSLFSKASPAQKALCNFFLQALTLEKKKHHSFFKLSDGEKKKTLLAQVFISQAPLLILDEPTAPLDKNTKEQLLKLLQKKKQKATLLITAHDFHSYLPLADQILLLKQNAMQQLTKQEAASLNF